MSWSSLSLVRCFQLWLAGAALLLAGTLALSAVHAAPRSSGLSVSVPNGYANVVVEDMRLKSVAGDVAWMRRWDGQEWKFNPHWESLSQSWKNLMGSQTADTADGNVPAAPSASAGSGSGGGGGCWVLVDEDWQPTPSSSAASWRTAS